MDPVDRQADRIAAGMEIVDPSTPLLKLCLSDSAPPELAGTVSYRPQHFTYDLTELTEDTCVITQDPYLAAALRSLLDDNHEPLLTEVTI